MPALKPDHIYVTDEEDAAITAAAMSDPDSIPLTDAEWEAVKPFVRIGVRPVGRPPVAVKRPTLSMRVDADVLAAFRQTGKGWQTRISALLREAVQAGRV